MKVTFSMRLDEGLRGRLEQRAVMEKRSLANLIERLLELGLGTVVTEREIGLQLDGSDPGTPGVRQHGTAVPTASASRSVTSDTCPVRDNHRAGTRCTVCGTTFAATRSVEVTPDPRVK